MKLSLKNLAVSFVQMFTPILKNPVSTIQLYADRSRDNHTYLSFKCNFSQHSTSTTELMLRWANQHYDSYSDVCRFLAFKICG